MNELILDNEYQIYVFNKMYKAPMNEKKRWDLYHNIVEELLHLSEYSVANEIKYRITDGEEPTEVLREKVLPLNNFSTNLEYLIKKL